jgi:iron complex outermembrane receptor protein
MFRSLRPAAIGVPVFAACLPSALAQMPPTATALPEVVVTAPAVRPAATVPDNATAAAEARTVPGNVTIVPGERINEAPAATTLEQALDFTPGVFARTKWGEDSRLSIRGSGLARNFHLRGVRILMDRMPLNEADGSGDFQEFDPLALQRIEVYRGANAFPFGANSLGGAINGVTHTGRSSPGITLRGEVGSNEFARSHAAYGIESGGVDAWAGVTNLTAEGWRQQSATRSTRFNSNLGYRLTDNAETRFYLNYNNIWQQIPGSLTRDAALRTPRQAAAANLAGNYMRNIESTRLGNITTIRATEGVTFDVGASLARRELDHPVFQYIDHRSDTANLFARATLEARLLGLENRLVVGANAVAGERDSQRFVNVRGHPGRLTASSMDRARTNDIYAENSLRVLPDLVLVTGLAAGVAYRESRDRFLSDGDASGSGRWNWVDPRLGLIWSYAEQAQLFANLSWSTEPPTLTDLTPLVPFGGFSRLDPQRAVTAELGTRGVIGAVAYEVALYRAWIRDEIQLLQGPVAGSTLAQNVDRTIHQGIEAGAGWTALRDALVANDSVQLRVAYTFSDFRFDGDATYGDNELPGAPRHLFRGEVRYNHPSGAWVAPNVDWVPSGLWADNANTVRTDAYALVGLRAGWDFGNGVTAFVDGRNLADTRYISSASVTTRATAASALFEPGFGRAVYGGLQFRF